FIERLILEDRNSRLSQLTKHQVERALSALERGRKGNIKLDALCLELAASLAGLRHSFFRQVDVTPTREQVFQVPIALAVTHEHKKPVFHLSPQISFKPRTSIIE